MKKKGSKKTITILETDNNTNWVWLIDEKGILTQRGFEMLHEEGYRFERFIE